LTVYHNGICVPDQCTEW